MQRESEGRFGDTEGSTSHTSFPGGDRPWLPRPCARLRATWATDKINPPQCLMEHKCKQNEILGGKKDERKVNR